jgi:hypothetical protein
MPYFKTKRVYNPDQNSWNRTTTNAIVSADRLNVSSTHDRTNVYAENSFAISGKEYRADSFPGTIIYYYEGPDLYFLKCLLCRLRDSFSDTFAVVKFHLFGRIFDIYYNYSFTAFSVYRIVN